jgi:peptidoglycan/LPS O-acetylase OafA/YrhL
LKYRAEVDGLRTVAVLPVILYHAGYSFFSGGYIGVDVFFVISGYLITTNIASEIEQGNFKLLKFYERRARRILPALFFVLLVAVIAALFISSKGELYGFGRSLSSVSVFLGNVFFWQTASYFDTGADLKPLLHTWSLAVEEQYYLIFPLLLMLGWKRFRKITLAVLILGALASFGLSVWGSANSPTANFFLLPFRFWELLAGALVALYLLKRQPSEEATTWMHQLIGLVAIALIAYPIFTYEQDTPFPGWYALAPVVGSVLVILFVRPATWVGRVLTWSPVVLIGKISYSAYLWHVPVFAFVRQYFSDAPGPVVMFGLSVLSLVAAYFSWKFVETPFRTNRFGRTFIFTGAVLGIVLFWAAGHGLRARASAMKVTLFEQRMADFAAQKVASWGECFIDSNSQGPDVFKPKCHAGETAEQKIVVWGDSHAAALAAGFNQNGVKIIQFTATDCPPIDEDIFPGHHYCYAMNNYALGEVGRIKPQMVVLDANWYRYTKRNELLRNTIAEIKRESPETEVVVVGTAPLWQGSLPTLLAKRNVELTPWMTVRDPMFRELQVLDKKMESIAGKDARFESALDALCKEERCLVSVLGPDGQWEPSAIDYGHLSVGAAQMVARRILGP